jgi:hypothetical protein
MTPYTGYERKGALVPSQKFEDNQSPKHKDHKGGKKGLGIHVHQGLKLGASLPDEESCKTIAQATPED